jgi:hypothetical protein
MTRPVTAETTARTIEELSALEAPWNALRRSHGSATPNTDPHRFAATVEALGDGVEPHRGRSSSPAARRGSSAAASATCRCRRRA